MGLARYLTAVANSGTCYNLTLIDKITDHRNALLEERRAEVRNVIEMEDAEWDAIHLGMRQVIENRADYQDLTISAAGKTGTAEENLNRANHALFVCYAPYEEPEIAISTRIAFGYTSSYAAKTTKDIINYYFGLKDQDAIITGNAQVLSGSTARTD